MLVRKHIHGLLSSYYKQPYNAVVGSVNPQNFKTSPIDFGGILGEWHWRYTYQRLYREQEGQWLTPVELFRPFYSEIIGNFVAKEVETMIEKGKIIEPFQIVEIGGGRGTNAMCILDHLERIHPQLYSDLESYTIMDSSPSLLDLMNKILIEGSISSENKRKTRSNRHVDKLLLKQVDMLDVAEKRSVLDK